ENWPLCGGRSATSPRPGTTCAARWKTCACYSKVGTWARFNQRTKTPTATWIDAPHRLIDTAGESRVFTGRDSAIVVTGVTRVMYGDVVHEAHAVPRVPQPSRTRQVECGYGDAWAYVPPLQRRRRRSFASPK